MASMLQIGVIISEIAYSLRNWNLENVWKVENFRRSCGYYTTCLFWKYKK